MISQFRRGISCSTSAVDNMMHRASIHLRKCGSSKAVTGRSTTGNRPSALTSVLPALVSLATPIASVSPSGSGRSYHRRYYGSRGTAFQQTSSLVAAGASAILALAASGALLGGSLLCQCEASTSNNPIYDESEDEEDDADNLPTYTMTQVSQNNGKGDSKRVWMTYGGCVYDVTDFIANHPGGSEKILLAAGGPIEPHWHLYRQHFATDLPHQLMGKMLIGNLLEADQEKVDDDMERLTEVEGSDPYENEPAPRSPFLKVHSEQSMNAEVPPDILGMEYITPTSEFYIRHHHPVPLLSEKQEKDFRLEVDLSLLSKQENNKTQSTKEEGKSHIAKLSMEQIKSLPKVEIITTLQCSGNRRSDFNGFRRTSGTPWGQGAISTAKWGGVRLADVLSLASKQLAKDDSMDGSETSDTSKSVDGSNGNNNLVHALQNFHTLLDKNPNIQHLRFESLDGMLASIHAIKALSPFGDVIIAYEMNGQPLPRDHGYPLRVIVPGYAAVRNIKWLKKLELAEEEALGAWQRGLNYKVLPPNVFDVKDVDLDKMPGLGEVAVFSGITNVSRADVWGEEKDGEKKELVPGETVLVKASGWAWAGGGRNIVRVDVTGNNGQTWLDAKITHGANQPFGRAWAWVFWECPAIPAKVTEDGTSVELSCKGVDMAFNSQPESSDGMWNVRGLANNSWYRLRYEVA